jgi:hypothetical protein
MHQRLQMQEATSLAVLHRWQVFRHMLAGPETMLHCGKSGG